METNSEERKLQAGVSGVLLEVFLSAVMASQLQRLSVDEGRQTPCSLS